MTLPYAERVKYWKTGKSDPDVWINRTKRQIRQLGGIIKGEAFVKNESGNGAYMLGFELEGDPFKLMWPVLPTKTGDERAAKVQAATLLYHDVVARCMTAVILGNRAAFFAFLVLPDGRTTSQVSIMELNEVLPKMLISGE